MSPETFAKEVGAEMKAARERLGITQEDLASVLGIPRTAVIGFESGERALSHWEATVLRGLLGVRADAVRSLAVVAPLKAKLRALCLYREREKLIRKIGEAPELEP